MSGGSGVIGAGTALAASSGSATVHFSNASAASQACKAAGIVAIYVTVEKVRGHTSKPKPGWHDLTSGAPIQLNLLEAQQPPESSNEPIDIGDCVLASAGAIDGLPAGRYQQLRVIVDVNGTPPSPNACADQLGQGVFNCVELNDGSFHALKIPSGAQTGIKINSSKLAKHGLTITPGQAVDLDIDIDGCRSITVTGGGRNKRKKPPHGGNPGYILKPVMQAGEVTLNSLISGQVVVGTNNGGTVSAGGTPVAGAEVWLEDATSTDSYTEGDPTPTSTLVPVNQVLAMTHTDEQGNFVFCPVPSTADKLELVASSATMPVGQGQTSNPSDVTITKGVTSGPTGGMSGLVIPLVEPSSAPTAGAEYTTASNANPPVGISETLDLGMAQSDGTNQAPFANASLSPVTTKSTTNGCSAACPSNTFCACETEGIPADNPVMGPAGDGSGYTQANGAAEYSLLAEGSVGSGPGSCSPNQMTTANQSTQNTPPNPALSFQACQ